MLSVIVKTVIIFLLVIIVVHLVILKSLDVSPPPPHIHHEQTIDHMVDQLIEKKIDEIFPIVQSSTAISPPPPSHKVDDLFNYVYNDTSANRLVPTPKPKAVSSSSSASASASSPALASAIPSDLPPEHTPTSILGVCAFEDEGASMYGVY